MEKISLASYSFHKLLEEGMIDLFGYLEATKYHYGVGYADIWNGFLVSYEEEYLKKVRRALDERDLVLANLCCDWAHPWADNEDDLSKQNDMAQKCLKAAEILGAQSVRFDVGVREDDISEQQLEQVSKAFAQYAQRGYDHGYRVGPENHWGASRRLSVQQALYARVNHPGYGMLIHLGNWNLADGETLDGNNVLAAPMAVHTHVDYTQSPRAVELLPPMRAAGYQGVWGVEHHTEVDEYRKVALQLAQVRLAKC